jgi:hypothetical protein
MPIVLELMLLAARRFEKTPKDEAPDLEWMR